MQGEKLNAIFYHVLLYKQKSNFPLRTIKPSSDLFVVLAQQSSSDGNCWCLPFLITSFSSSSFNPGLDVVLHHLQRVGDQGEGPLPWQPAAALHLHPTRADRHPAVCPGVRRTSKQIFKRYHWLVIQKKDNNNSLTVLCENFYKLEVITELLTASFWEKYSCPPK